MEASGRERRASGGARAPDLAEVLARCSLPGTRGFEAPTLERPRTVNVAEAGELGDLERRGVTIETSGRASARQNWVVYEEACEHFGAYRIRFEGTGNVCVLAGQEGERAALRGRAIFVGSRCVAVLGRRRTSKAHVSMRLWNDDQVFFWGNGSTSNGSDFILQGEGRRVLVGEDCMFATGIWVRTSDMHAIADLSTGEQINRQTDVILEPHVWVGQDALLLGCERVGYGTVIGAKSLLRDPADPLSIYGGVPARKLRENVTWDRAAVLRPETIEYVRGFGED